MYRDGVLPGSEGDIPTPIALPASWTVKQISSDRAENFVDSVNPDDLVIGKTLSFGLFKDDLLSGVIQVASPLEQVFKRIYTRELVRAVFVDNTDNWTLPHLVELYIKKRKPADIFVSLDILGVEHLLRCGFTVVDQSPGGIVFEWFNPNIAFYTYRLHAEGSEKYYFGVKSIKKPYETLTVDDCLEDGYLGSGKSAHFLRWRDKNLPKIKKTVLSTYREKRAAYFAEAEAIGDLWKTDPNCLNSANGGGDGGLLVELVLIKERECPTHGLTKHIGEKCYKCRSSALSEQNCTTHGRTLHQGKTCLRCTASKMFTKQRCNIHGVTIFRGSECDKCRARKLYKEEACSVHGVTTHRAGVCNTCTAESSFRTGNCSVHGEAVKFQGSKCVSCHNLSSLSLKNCAVHGETMHIGESCRKCSSLDAVSTRKCEVHGLSTHLGANCCSCHSLKSVSMKNCATHGVTKFRGESCSKCLAAKVYSTAECPKHGLVQFRGSSCQKCIGEKVSHRKGHKEGSVPDCEYCL